MSRRLVRRASRLDRAARRGSPSSSMLLTETSRPPQARPVTRRERSPSAPDREGTGEQCRVSDDGDKGRLSSHRTVLRARAHAARRRAVPSEREELGAERYGAYQSPATKRERPRESRSVRSKGRAAAPSHGGVAVGVSTRPRSRIVVLEGEAVPAAIPKRRPGGAERVHCAPCSRATRLCGQVRAVIRSDGRRPPELG